MGTTTPSDVFKMIQSHLQFALKGAAERFSAHKTSLELHSINTHTHKFDSEEHWFINIHFPSADNPSGQRADFLCTLLIMEMKQEHQIQNANVVSRFRGTMWDVLCE